MNTPARSIQPLVEKPLLLTWIALLLLVVATVGSAYVPLGWFNGVLNIAIACVKAGLVMLVYMHLTKSGALVRVFAFGVFAWILVLMALSFTDYLTRPG